MLHDVETAVVYIYPRQHYLTHLITPSPTMEFAATSKKHIWIVAPAAFILTSFARTSLVNHFLLTAIVLFKFLPTFSSFSSSECTKLVTDDVLPSVLPPDPISVLAKAEKVLFQGTTTKGKPCRNPAKVGTLYCRPHKA